MIGFGTGFLLTGELSSAITTSVAAVLPDAMEKIGHLITLTRDRGATHNPLYWGIAIPIVTVLAYISGGVDLLDYAIVSSVGLMTHLVGDVLTQTGVPISRNGQVRIALKLFRAGHPFEYLIVTAFLAFCFREYIMLALGEHFNSPTEFMNPLTYIEKGAYVQLWNNLYELFFRGFMARFFAVAFLLGALWFGFYRQNFIMAVVLFSLTVVICYLGSMVEAAFWFLK